MKKVFLTVMVCLVLAFSYVGANADKSKTMDDLESDFVGAANELARDAEYTKPVTLSLKVFMVGRANNPKMTGLKDGMLFVGANTGQHKVSVMVYFALNKSNLSKLTALKKGQPIKVKAKFLQTINAGGEGFIEKMLVFYQAELLEP